MSIPISTTNMCRARAPMLRQAFRRRPTHCSAASMADCRPATRRGCSKRRKAAPASDLGKRASDMEKAAGMFLPPFLCFLRPAGYCWAGAAGCSGAASPWGRCFAALFQRLEFRRLLGDLLAQLGKALLLVHQVLAGFLDALVDLLKLRCPLRHLLLTGRRRRGGRSLRYRGPGLRTGSVPRPWPGRLRPGRSGRRRAVRPGPPRRFAARWFERSGPVPAAAAGFQPRSAGSAGLRRLADAGCSQAPGGRR